MDAIINADWMRKNGRIIYFIAVFDRIIFGFQFSWSPRGCAERYLHASEEINVVKIAVDQGMDCRNS